jgi:drug/metabolite transporter (DMT)-like permease
VIVGLALAVACAVGTSVAFLFKHRGAVLAPPVSVRHPLRSGVDLFRSRWFAVGWIVAVGAWALHVGALALAPLSIVQAVLSGGLVFLAVFAERFFGFRLGRRQWAGVIITAAGLAVIGLTSGPDDGELELISPWIWAALIASVGAFYASARGLQLGPGVEVIALTSVAANLTAIVGGILVFRDPVGTGALEITGRMLAFGLVVAGAALIPAPVRATDAPSDASGEPRTQARVPNP